MRPKIILVVEDNEVTRKLARVTLCGAGHLVEEAESGQAALERLNQLRPDLILLDLILPDALGTDLLADIRARTGGAVPVLACSGFYGRAEDAGRDLDMFDGFLPKPIRPSRLVELAAAFLESFESPEERTRQRALIADDDVLQRKLLRLQLEHAGFEVRAVESGAALLQELPDYQPDVVVSDVLMPGLDGFQLCDRIRQDARNARLPVVLMSAHYFEAADRVLARELGAYDLVERTANAAPAIEAALAALAQPAVFARQTDCASAPYVERVHHQLDRQLALNAELSQRSAIQHAGMTFLGRLSAAVASRAAGVEPLTDLLGSCLDAAGASMGAIYTPAANGDLELRSSIGIPASLVDEFGDFFGTRATLLAAAAAPVSITFDPDELPPRLTELTDIRGLMLVPLPQPRSTPALLLLASSTRDVDDDWRAFAEAISLELNQAVALIEVVEQLSASEAKYRSLIENVDAIVWETNERLETVFVSERIEALLGYRVAEVLRDPSFRERIVHPADRERVRTAVSRALRAGHDFELEYRVISALNEEIWLRDAVQLERAADGRLLGLRGITIEITQQKQKAQALEESEARFRMLAENIPDVFWITSANFDRPVYVSPAYEAVWGRGHASYYANHDWLEAVHPDDVPRLKQLVSQVGQGYDADYRIVHPDGSIRWVRDRAFPVYDREGVVVQMAGVASDITEQKLAGAAIEAAEAQIRNMVDSSPTVTYALRIGAKGVRPVWVSGNVERVLGYSESEVLEPAWWLENVHPDDLERAIRTVLTAPIGEGGARQYRLRQPDGAYIWIREAFSARQSGDEIEIIGSCTDWSEPKRLEEQFEHAQRMEVVGRLAGGVAHDFNNLLTAITGYAQLLSSSCTADDPRLEDIMEIDRAAQRAAGLTRQLLAFSRRQIMQPRTIAMNTVLRNMERLLRRIIGEDLEFTIECDDALRSVYADAGQMEQVIVNLAVNARDAMPDGGRLVLRTANRQVTPESARALRVPPGDYVTIAVCDSGTGIEPGILQTIFEPFFTTKPTGAGTGLGLATVQGIVQQSDGHVTVDSIVGQGTTVQVYLPATDAVVEPARESVMDRPDAGRQNATVLLVEDEPAVRALVSRVLTRQGYRVIEAADAAAALAAAELVAMDLLITDVVLPGLSGPRLAAQLQQAQPGLRVLFTSGYADDEVFERGVKAGAAHFLAKPFTPSQLLKAVAARFAADDR